MSKGAVEARRARAHEQKRAQKRADDLASQARAGLIWSMAARRVREIARPGTTTAEMDEVIEALVRTEGGVPTNKGYDHGGRHRPYPAATCFMPNDMVTHGIPNTRPLRDGDLLTFDMGVTVDEMHADAAITFMVGEIPESVQDVEAFQLMAVCRAALYAGIAQAVPGGYVGDISRAIESTIEPYGFSIVRDFCGHGINRIYHDEPQVPNFFDGDRGPRLYDGQVLAIEPIITAGSPEIRVADDGWSIWTADGSLAAQFEHTVVCGKVPRILTEEKPA